MSDDVPTLEALFDGDAVFEGDRHLRPSAVVEDSRSVVPGALFVARLGHAGHGGDFITDAVSRGAAAVVVGHDQVIPADARPQAVVRVANPTTAGASAAHRFSGEPAKTLDVVAVTGTNGKTTVAWFVRSLLAAVSRRCGMLGTIEVDDGASCTPASLTTPSACDLADALGRMVAHGCDSVVLEASSHALEQGRLHDVHPRFGIFTNLSGDHLDYHGSLEAYAAAKARLFTMLPDDGVAVVNADDPAHAQMSATTRARVIRCSTLGAEADASARIVAMDRGGSTIIFEGPWGTIEARVGLVGRHNAENLLLATTVVSAMGIPVDAIQEALPTLVAPPGRLEPVTAPDAPFSVFVDYAHTDDALENVLSAVRPLVRADGRLSVVFGCGGDRDRTKRPRMARVACAQADRVFVTSDNPRTESPASIVEEVLTGVPEDTHACVFSEVDREQAIQRALSEATPGEIVLIAGKGHEDYQILGTERRDFDDRLVARAALAMEARL